MTRHRLQQRTFGLIMAAALLGGFASDSRSREKVPLPPIEPVEYSSMVESVSESRDYVDWSYGEWTDYYRSKPVAWAETSRELFELMDAYPRHDRTRAEFEEIQVSLSDLLERAANDVLALQVLAHACGVHSRLGCSDVPIYEQLLSIDGNNLASYLHALRSQRPGFTHPIHEVVADTDTPRVRDWILRASYATDWRSWEARLLVEKYPLAVDFVTHTPPPDKLIAQLPSQALALTLAQMRSFPGGDRDWPLRYLGPLCASYRVGEPELFAACENIAKRLQDRREPFGFQLASEWLTPDERAGAKGLALMRRNTMNHYIVQCMQPRWLVRGNDWPLLPPHWFDAYIDDVASLGLKEARLVSATRERNAYPDSYGYPPERCEDLAELEGDDLAAALGERDPVGVWELEVQRRAMLTENTDEVSDVALSALVSSLEERDAHDRSLAERLSRFGARAMPGLLEALCFTDPARDNVQVVHSMAATALSQMDDPALLPEILDQFGESQRLQRHCSEYLVLSRLVGTDREHFRAPRRRALTRIGSSS